MCQFIQLGGTLHMVPCWMIICMILRKISALCASYRKIRSQIIIIKTNEPKHYNGNDRKLFANWAFSSSIKPHFIIFSYNNTIGLYPHLRQKLTKLGVLISLSLSHLEVQFCVIFDKMKLLQNTQAYQIVRLSKCISQGSRVFILQAYH